MHVISKKKLMEFWKKHPEAKLPLSTWYGLLKGHTFNDLTELQNAFSDVEFIGEQRYVFNIKGNYGRVICVIQFKHQTAFVRAVLTHSEYDELCQSAKKKRKSDKTLFNI